MLKLSHSAMTFISGAVWLAIGIFLLQLGLNLLFVQLFDLRSTTPLLNLLRGLLNHQEAAVLIAAIALYIGFLKGKHVLTKAANRGIERTLTLPNPAPIHQIYSRQYYLLIGIMVLLGISIKFLGLPNDIRGAIDIAIGSALINGSIHYFRVGFKLRNTAS